MGYKIREALQDKKTPYVIGVGDNEVKENKISLRKRKVGDVGTFELSQFINNINEEIKNKS